jgi:hypothetical protein
MRTRRSYVALGLVVIALVAGACGGGEDGPTSSPADVRGALRGEGLEICTESGLWAPKEAVAGAAFTVGLRCGEDDEQAVVEVVEWPDAAARDAALRRFDVQSRPSSANHGTTWALGFLTVHVEGERDDEVVERVANAMDRLGAS